MGLRKGWAAIVRTTLVAVLATACVSVTGGEADAFTLTAAGYVCVDSEETTPNAPTMAWDDISVTGTATNIIGDDNAATFPLPFTFNYFLQPQFQISICTNGFANFGPLATTFGNGTLPGVGAPNGTLAMFWDDMITNNGQMIRFQTLGAAPARRFVISWLNVPHLGGAANVLMTCQIILFEAAGANAIKYQYQTITGTGAAGNSATVGIEDMAGTQANQYQFNGNPATNNTYSNLVIGYFPVGSTPPWQAAPPPPPAPPAGGGGVSTVPIKDEKREHRACGGSAGVAGGMLGLACVLAMGLGLWAGGRRG